MNAFTPVEIKPGNLITAAAPENVGIQNYLVKRDFRRVLDREVRREGYALFDDKAGPVPGNEPVQFLCEARALNGRTVVIAATSQRLYRYAAYDEPLYFDDQSGGYFEAGYFRDAYDYWEQIGESTLPTKWEAVNVNGNLILNPRLELPFIYRVGDELATRANELRDLGISCVDTIAEFNGILMCANVTQIKEDKLPAWMSGQVENELLNASYDVIEDDSIIDRYQNRIIWSMPGAPTRFAASVPATMNAGARVVTFGWPTRSFENGQQIIVQGAGLNGGNLTATVIWMAPDRTSAYLDAAASVDVTDSFAQALDSLGSIVGFEDLADDGSAVLRMMPLRTHLVVYKDTSIFIGAYTGQTTSPFVFDRKYRGADGLFYRDTLVSLDNEGDHYHFYAGRKSFYRFDLATLTPRAINREIENTFFDRVGNAPAVFAAENAATKEIFLCFPNGADDNAICFDYKYGTVSTTSAIYRSAATVTVPSAYMVSGEDFIFVMGADNGVVLRYGLGTNQPAIYDRLGAGYQSIIQTGQGGLGSKLDETLINGYQFRGNTVGDNASVTISTYDYVNGVLNTGQAFNCDISNRANPFIPCAALAAEFSLELEVSGAGTQCEVVGHIFNAKEIHSGGAQLSGGTQCQS